MTDSDSTETEGGEPTGNKGLDAITADQLTAAIKDLETPTASTVTLTTTLPDGGTIYQTTSTTMFDPASEVTYTVQDSSAFGHGSGPVEFWTSSENRWIKLRHLIDIQTADIVWAETGGRPTNSEAIGLTETQSCLADKLFEGPSDLALFTPMPSTVYSTEELFDEIRSSISAATRGNFTALDQTDSGLEVLISGSGQEIIVTVDRQNRIVSYRPSQAESDSHTTTVEIVYDVDTSMLEAPANDQILTTTELATAYGIDQKCVEDLAPTNNSPIGDISDECAENLTSNGGEVGRLLSNRDEIIGSTFNDIRSS